MTKVLKVYLISNVIDKNGIEVPYNDVCKILWDLQKQTREIKNKTIQLCWEWFNFQSDYNKTNGVYPKDKDVLGYVLDGFIYDKLKSVGELNSGNATTTMRDASGCFKNSKMDIIKGDKSIMSYGKDQPLDLHNRSISFSYDKDFKVDLSLLNKAASYKYSIKRMNFRCVVKDNSTKTILERCIDGVYKVSASKLIYDRKKKMWKLNLCYSFENKNIAELDKDKILGVDLGISKPIVASVYGDWNRYSIDGDEIIKFRQRTEQRRISLLRQTKVSGNGKIGHGRNTRCKSIDVLSGKIARFRDSVNHKYSRALIDYAIKNNCGTIQMEDLSGISKDDPFLKNWSYFDLQTKIEYKAKEQGINVIKINPKYTSQRCSKCGFIDKENRKTQATFECLKCGFKTNADYNASQNIAIRDIDKIISANMKLT